LPRAKNQDYAHFTQAKREIAPDLPGQTLKRNPFYLGKSKEHVHLMVVRREITPDLPGQTLTVRLFTKAGCMTLTAGPLPYRPFFADRLF